MRVLNFGSLNIDNVCRVNAFVRPGETVSALSFTRNSGGKGLNQSVALARAGVQVYHAGRIGRDGNFLRQELENAGVDCRYTITADDELTGCAMIQVADDGENSIVLAGGANMNITTEQINRTFAEMQSEDILLLQNEISRMDEIINTAAAKGMRIFFNPAPMNSRVMDLPLGKIDTFIVNELEAAGLAETSPDSPPEDIIKIAGRKFPGSNILMTLGAKGAMYMAASSEKISFIPSAKAGRVVDTTAAGDTFIGYFLAGIIEGLSETEAMTLAAKASACCIAHHGAAASIPMRSVL